MNDWSAETYLRFAAERTRPAADLLGRLPLGTAEHIVDIGCGPGNSTELLAARWPAARIEGFDSSPAMLAAARERLPAAYFFAADVAAWRPNGSESLLFANAVFQWVPDHLSVLERLLVTLRPGAALAVQMPDNLAQPSHRLMRDVALAGEWRDKFADVDSAREILPPADAYYDRLRPYSSQMDVWRTTYFHELAGVAALVTWLKGTGLRPYLAPLNENEHAAFLEQFAERLSEAYPLRPNGSLLLPFPRLFVVALRR